MNNNQKFKTFLESLEDSNNKQLLEAIKNGFVACFESMVNYVGVDPFFNKKKEYFKITEDIPMEIFEEEEALTQIIEAWKRREPSDEHLEFILAKNPKVVVNGHMFNLTKHPGWNTLRKIANKLYAARISNLKSIKEKDAEISIKNILRSQKMKSKGAINPKLMKAETGMKERKFKSLDKGLKEFAKAELAV